MIGGSSISAGEHPWFGVILKQEKVHCGCSLITHTWCLTAAHCFAQENHQNLDNKYVLFFGKTSLGF